MAKRRRNKKPNLPQATLDRARRQAGLEPEAEEQEDAALEAAEEAQTEDVEEAQEALAASDDNADDAQAAARARRAERAARRRKVSPVQLERVKKNGEISSEMMRDMLANPTEVVTEEELRAEYGHVLADLRNMGILAAVLMVVLVGLAQLL